MIVKYC